MFDDDDLGFSGYGRVRTSRVFAEIRDDQGANIQAWKAGIASIKSGDPEGMLRFLLNAKGKARLLNTRGGEARGPIAKAILALRNDPSAWLRLNEASWIWRSRRLPDEDPEPEIPDSVSPIQFLWGAAPHGLAQAARLWRQAAAAEGKWWSSPFIAHGYEGPPELCRSISGPANRLLNPESHCQGAPDDAPPHEERYSDHSDGMAMAAILSETARACIDQLWSHEERSGPLRLSGGRVWSRGGIEWGLRWHGSRFNVELGPGSQPKTVMMAAGMGCIQEGIAAGPAEAALACRKVAIGAEGSPLGDDVVVAVLRAWLAAFPDDAGGLPFSAGDWLPAKRLFSLCGRAGVSDDALGRWLARDGRQWSTPACLARNEELKEATPSWAGGAPDQNGVAMPGSWAAWTPLEWAILERPKAALLACQAGAAICHGVEALLLSQVSVPSRQGEVFEQAHAVAEACRLSELCPEPSEPSPARSPFKSAL